MTKYPNTQRRSNGQVLKAVEDSGAWEAERMSLEMVLKEGNGGDGKIYDLEERTALFGEAAIRFAKKIPRNPVNDRLISQFVGAATSIGANYCEADDAVSRKDFKCKIGTCKKESKETKYFLRMLATAEENLASEARKLWREAKELHLIFCSIYKK